MLLFMGLHALIPSSPSVSAGEGEDTQLALSSETSGSHFPRPPPALALHRTPTGCEPCPDLRAKDTCPCHTLGWGQAPQPPDSTLRMALQTL